MVSSGSSTLGLYERLAPEMWKPALAKRANVGSWSEPEGKPTRKTRSAGASINWEKIGEAYLAPPKPPREQKRRSPQRQIGRAKIGGALLPFKKGPRTPGD